MQSSIYDFTEGATNDDHLSKLSYKNGRHLRRLYWDEGHSTKEIASILNVSSATICRWMERHGIETRTKKQREVKQRQEKEYVDEDLLRELHHQEKLNLREIGEIFGVTGNAIRYWLQEFDIDIKNHNVKFSEFELGGHSMSMDGYPSIRIDGEYIFEHQLVALGNGEDPRKIFKNNDHQIHHINGMKCDNRPSNLELMTAEEHGAVALKRRRGEEVFTISEVQSFVKHILAL